MPVKAYILVDTTPGVKTSEILGKLKAVKSIKSAEAVSGPHDIVVIAETADLQGLGELVITKVRAIEGITKTITCCCV